MNAMDDAVERFLKQIYEFKPVKVGATTKTITSKRKERIGVKYKALGIFPIYNYRYWNVELNEWGKGSLVPGRDLLGVLRETEILYCLDEFNEIIYWKYKI